jgi:hypothetical protein
VKSLIAAILVLVPDLMRHFLTIPPIIFFSFTGFGQTKDFVKLLDKISNQQIVIMEQYVWYPKMFSPAGDSLIKIGKPATNELVALLNDTGKGIIVHYILSNIWAREAVKAGRSPGSNVYPVPGTGNAVLKVLYNGFIFYIGNNSHVFAKGSDLEANEKFWLNLLNTENIN